MSEVKEDVVMDVVVESAAVDAGPHSPAPSPWEPEGDEDGYLTDEWLDAFRAWTPEPWQAGRWMVNAFPLAVACLSCARCEVSDHTDDLRGEGKLIDFSTGGWSGAEELVGEVLAKFWLCHFHARWERGGHYEFEVPLATLNLAAPARDGAEGVHDGSQPGQRA